MNSNLGYDFNTAIYAILISFVSTLILCPTFIPFLTRLKFGQMVRDDGPQTHLKKAGTPTMGGIVIVISFVIGSFAFLKSNNDAVAVVLVTVGFGIIGLCDDYIKIVKRRSMGLRAWQKMLAQIVIAALFSYYLYSFANIGTEIFIPFAKGLYFDLGIWFYPFLSIVMVGTVNGANLTDGLDGLATGVTILIALFFLFISLTYNTNILPVTGAAVGALIGFLLFNAYPARVFMGDTGSLALGGLIASVAVLLKMPLLIVIVGIIYVVEAMSVILQVGYFKATKGKRLFKMAPLHHHFEMLGWPETKVVTMFYVVTAIMCLVGFLALKV